MIPELHDLDSGWDLIIIGGGITGAGILREGTRFGLKCLLLEQRDFAWGTSSRSSKMVHGGIRYLKQGRYFLTRESVIERERLMAEAPGLVDSMEFLMPVYADRGPGMLTLKAGLCIYDLVARRRGHRFYGPRAFSRLEPLAAREGLQGAFSFFDAQTDDARLVLRLIAEAAEGGASALNHTRVTGILRNQRGKAAGVRAEDVKTGVTAELKAEAVINATGAWAERLHSSPAPDKHLRPLRGSHLVFEAGRIPVRRTVGFAHPEDDRPMFVIPWEGAVMVGTTDLDHRSDLNDEPRISPEETAYILAGIQKNFPALNLKPEDAVSAFAGVRPVLSGGNRSPSKESREHAIWVEEGLVTITGGKLTTFRKLAWSALRAVKPYVKGLRLDGRREPAFAPAKINDAPETALPDEILRRIFGRYGTRASAMLRSADPSDLSLVPGTQTLWAELPFAAKEQVRNLEDLMLRRVRIGLLLHDGGAAHLDRIQERCEPVLQWGNDRWVSERQAYQHLWNQFYRPGIHGRPPSTTVGDSDEAEKIEDENRSAHSAQTEMV